MNALAPSLDAEKPHRPFPIICAMLACGLLHLTACNQSQNDPGVKFDPCQSIREADPHCGWNAHWEDSGISVNKIDGSKTEFLETESLDADGMDYGDLHYATLTLCFENGKLCHGQSIGVAVKVHGMVSPSDDESEYSTSVRLRFDDGAPTRQTWGISDDHDALFPRGHEKQFATQLKQHKKLILEFSYYEKAPRTVSFDLTGLDGAMQLKGLQLGS